jgi:hypothetical protein
MIGSSILKYFTSAKNEVTVLNVSVSASSCRLLFLNFFDEDHKNVESKINFENCQCNPGGYPQPLINIASSPIL